MRLQNFMRSYRDELRERWSHAVREGFPSESELTPEQLENSLTLYLEQLADAVGELQRRRESPGQALVAREHGSQRQVLGRSIAELVREYGLLFECVLQVADERGIALAAPELLQLSRYLYGSAAQAVDEFSQRAAARQRETELKHLSFLAHELRNPLGSAQLAWSTLRRQQTTLSGRAADLVGRCLSRVITLLDATLFSARLAHLEGGFLQASMERLDLNALLAELRDEAEADAELKAVVLEIEAGGCVEVSGDPRLLLSALANVVKNAIKYTRAGGTVKVQCRTTDGRAMVEVQDECGGLAAHDTEKLFEAFQQANQNRHGYGLGLAIAKQAVEAHGGTIIVKNREGVGCTFLLDLPL
jgi:signal transduction histidine kinase